MPGLSFTKKQLTSKYLDKLASKVFGRRASVEYVTTSASDIGTIPASEIVLDTAREREYNQIIARHLREAREREAEGKPLTQVQKDAQYWRKKEENNDIETFSRLHQYSPEKRARMERIIYDRARAHIEADRAEEERDLPPYTIPAPAYRGRKTPWRTLKSKMTKTFFGSRKKTSSPAPLYYPPRYSDIEVGGRKIKRGRRKTRKLRRN